MAKLIVTKAEVAEEVSKARSRGKSIGLVPTMGALHRGHLSLVEASVDECDVTAATIFVNPTQFEPTEDLDRYPRDLQADMKLLEEVGTDIVFAPPVDQLYRPGHSTFVQPPEVANRLEGKFRPTHFRGVTTIVLKLFHIIPADVAFFGQKDYQQTRVIQEMVDDLDVPVQLRICPIVREADGLALSSRNQYLTQEQRSQAPALSEALRLAVQRFRSGERDAVVLRDAMVRHLSSAGIDRLDYVSLVSPRELESVDQVCVGTVALVAAHVGDTRLIDNVRFELE